MSGGGVKASEWMVKETRGVVSDEEERRQKSEIPCSWMMMRMTGPLSAQIGIGGVIVQGAIEACVCVCCVCMVMDGCRVRVCVHTIKGQGGRVPVQ